MRKVGGVGAQRSPSARSGWSREISHSPFVHFTYRFVVAISAFIAREINTQSLLT